MADAAGGRLDGPTDPAHRKMWTDLLTMRPMLATVSQRSQCKGYGEKRGPTARAFFNWQKTFFVLQKPFLLYFASNQPTACCLGVIYLNGATIENLPQYPKEKHVVKIVPTVRRNLTHFAKSDDEHNFYLKFESDKELSKWMSQLSAAIGPASRALPAEAAAVMSAASRFESINARHEATISLNDLDHIDVPRTFTVASSFVDVDNSSALVPMTVQGQSQPPASKAPAMQRAHQLVAAEAKRKSFFNVADAVKPKNSDAVHTVACHRCAVSPICGFQYTCVTCELDDVESEDPSHGQVRLCGSCFYSDDHHPSHQFVVEPAVDGDVLRLSTPAEGTAKPFRVIELVAFEALFRVISGAVEDTSTRPVSKRRLLMAWNAGLEAVRGAPPLSERDLAFCRAPGAVGFDEFIWLIRRVLMKGDTTYASVTSAFNVISDMARFESGALLKSNERPVGNASLGANATAALIAMTRLESAALRTYVATVSTASCDVILDDDCLAVLTTLEIMKEGSEVASQTRVVEDYGLSHHPTVAGVASADFIGRVKIMARDVALLRNALVADPNLVAPLGAEALRHPAHHGVIEAFEHALLWHRGEGMGMYSAQVESFHACCCDSCGVSPIVGYRFQCDVCDDVDLCASCFFRSRGGHTSSHGFRRQPGDVECPPLQSSMAGPSLGADAAVVLRRTTRGSSTVSKRSAGGSFIGAGPAAPN